MLKIKLFLFLGCISCFTAIAQKNKIYFTINSIKYFNVKVNSADSMLKTNNRTFQILPSIGYGRIFKNNFGMELEFGYKNSSYHQNMITTNVTNGYNQEILNSLPFIRSYYFCPSVFKMYNWNNFEITASLVLPLEYVTKRE